MAQLNRRSGRWREVALIIALAAVLVAIAALGIHVLSTWDVTGPPAAKATEAGRLQGRPVER